MADSNPQPSPGEETEKMCWQCGRTFTTAMDVCPDDGARLIETDVADKGDPLIGTVFDGRFRIVRKLGEGGMGAVYSARRLDFETDVALKLLKGDFTTNEGIRKRFMYEARVISNLKHPHAIQVFDFGQTTEGHVYMVMELLDGESLADRLAYRFVTYREIFDIIPPICGVLGEAHTRDVVHRDLKPENIFLLEVDGNEEFPKLLDFGIAKHNRAETMTKSGTLWGTPAYMSPEQARGASVGAPADIYGIAIMLFELITGNLPFNASTQMGYAVKHIKSPIRPPSSVPGLDSIPPELDEFIVQMLAKNPDERPGSMEVVADALNRIRDDYFDEQLLDSIPAKEVDPIRLQRWLDEAPDVSGELPAEGGWSGENGDAMANGDTAAMAVAETARIETGEGEEAAGEAVTRKWDGGDDVDQAVAEGEEERPDRQLAEAPTVALRSGREPTKHIQGGEEDDADSPRNLGLVIAAAVAVLVFGGGAMAMLWYDGVDEPVGQHQAQESAPTGDSEQQPGQPDQPIDAGQAVPAAASHASTVILETYGIVQQMDPEELDDELEEGFDFLHQPVDEESGGDSGDTAEDRSRRLQEALEKTF